ncbi:MAG: MFS transporter [Eggerthellaceae bacterium]|nr:MFS transporter [Eggerthellaceae bacterium]
MKIKGAKRWVVLVVLSLFAGEMVYTPYIRFNYYDQMAIAFTEYKPIVDAANVNEFIGTTGMIVGFVSMIMYIVGGLLADKFRERNLILLGGVTLAAGAAWFGLLPDANQILAAHAVMALGVGFMWSAYLKTTRKLGNAHEQGRMFSTSEFIRGIIGTALGFMGVALLNQGILPSGEMDPSIIGPQLSLLLFINAGMFLVLSFAAFMLIPKNLVGNEDADDAEQVPFSFRFMLDAAKLPAVWFGVGILFCGYSLTAAASGYLGTYTVQVLGVDPTAASSFAIVRNYIIAAVSTLLIGFVALFFKSEIKTLGIYMGVTAAVVALLMLFSGNTGIGIAITFVFAFFYTGMRGLYFATLSEMRVPVHLTGIAIGVMSFLGYTPDVFFSKIAGIWLDSYGTAGFTYIWAYAIACGVLGVVVAFFAYRYAKKKQAEVDGAAAVPADAAA